MFLGLSSSIISKRIDGLMALVSLLAITGTIVMLSGGVWDAASHALREPELFWSIQHVVVYTGVGLSTVAGLAGYTIFRVCTNTRTIKNFSLGIKVLVIGAALQVISGFGDSLSHDIFGIDGLLSLSHQPLELGLALVALGGFLIIKNISYNNKYTKMLRSFSIISFIVTTSWLGFNLMLILGGVFMCIPVYLTFSSGCAIL